MLKLGLPFLCMTEARTISKRDEYKFLFFASAGSLTKTLRDNETTVPYSWRYNTWIGDFIKLDTYTDG